MDYRKLNWQSDYPGDEIGYDDILQIGIYQLIDFPEITILIDVVNDKILEVWLDEED